MVVGRENQTKRILVVDDNHEVLNSLKLVLTQNGYEVLIAQNGQEALEMLQIRPIDLILSDVAMPQVNGYQLFQMVRESSDPWLVSIPFIFISGRATLDSDIRFAKSLGADDYIVKPVATENLLAIVQGKLLAAERLHKLFEPHRSESLETILLKINQRQLHLDCRQHRAWLDDREIELTAREMFLLEHLARQPNKVVSVVELFRVTSGHEVERQEAGRLLRPVIHSLRRKLKMCLDGQNCIKNVRGRGYMFIVS